MIGSISVGIVNFNTRNDLKLSLDSLCVQQWQVSVFDNASSDGSREMLAAEFPSVTVHASERNVGFAKAANELMRWAATDYLLLLNSDTRVEPGAVDALSRYLDQHPKAAVIGPRLSNLDGTLQPSCFPFPGTLKWLVDNDEISVALRHVPRLRDWLFRSWPHNRERVVPWV